MFDQIFLLQQVERSMIISDKQGMHKLPHKLSNNLNLRILGTWEIPGKLQNFLEL